MQSTIQQVSDSYCVLFPQDAMDVTRAGTLQFPCFQLRFIVEHLIGTHSPSGALSKALPPSWNINNASHAVTYVKSTKRAIKQTLKIQL